MKEFFKKIVILLLTVEAKAVLKKHKPKIVAITGTVGKTSTKDAVAHVLAPFVLLRKSRKSFNSEFGIPLTILGLKNAGRSPLLWLKNLLRGALVVFFPQANYPKWLVLEVGAGKEGDIKRFAEWLSPDIAIVTRFADVPVHTEFFSSPEAVIADKTELARAVRAGGTIILGTDDPRVAMLSKEFPDTKVLTYGREGRTDVFGADYRVLYEHTPEGGQFPVGFSFEVGTAGRTFPLEVRGIIGAHMTQPLLAGFAAALALDADPERAAEALQSAPHPPGRMRLISGKNGSLIIDDSYNASPVAMREALATLAALEVKGLLARQAGRKIAVLGGMAELGAFSAEEHRKAEELALHSCEKLILVGKLWKEVGDNPQIQYVASSREAADALARDIRAGDVVLVKGSQSERMERVVKALMAKPECAKELLVRQEKEWLS